MMITKTVNELVLIICCIKRMFYLLQHLISAAGANFAVPVVNASSRVGDVMDLTSVLMALTKNHAIVCSLNLIYSFCEVFFAFMNNSLLIFFISIYLGSCIIITGETLLIYCFANILEISTNWQISSRSVSCTL